MSAAGEPCWSFHTKPLSPLVPGQGTGSQPAGTPGSARAMKDLAWRELSLGRPSTFSGLGRNPGLCLCQVFYFCCAPESHTCAMRLRLDESKDLVIPDG